MSYKRLDAWNDKTYSDKYSIGFSFQWKTSLEMLTTTTMRVSNISMFPTISKQFYSFNMTF